MNLDNDVAHKDLKESESKAKGIHMDEEDVEKDSSIDIQDKNDCSGLENEDVKSEVDLKSDEEVEASSKEATEVAKEKKDDIETNQDEEKDTKEEQDDDVEDKNVEEHVDEAKADISTNNTKDILTKGNRENIVDISDGAADPIDKNSVNEDLTPEELKTTEKEAIVLMSEDSEEIQVLDDQDPLAKVNEKDSKANDKDPKVDYEHPKATNESETIDEVVVEKKTEKTTITFKPVIEEDSDDEDMIQEIDKDEIILEDDVQSSSNIGEKRKAESEEKTDGKKKQKLDETFRKLRRMRRRDLETELKKKIIELFIYKDEIGNLRRQCDKFKKSAEVWKDQSDILSKNLKDLSTVQRKYMNEKAASNGTKQIVPTKITRSVGLMVIPPEKRGKKKVVAGSVGVGPGPASMKRVAQQQQPVQRPIQQPQQVQKNTPPRSIHQVVQRPAGNVQQYVAAGPGSGNKGVLVNNRSPVRQVNGVHQRVVMSSANGATMMRPVNASVIMTNGMSASNHQSPRTLATPVSLPSRPPQLQQQQPRHNNKPEVVDLSDDDTPTPARAPVNPRTHGSLSVRPVQGLMQQQVRPPQQRVLLRHPAPLPSGPRPMNSGSLKSPPPKPTLTIGRGSEGVVLKWNMVMDLLQHETVISYQIFAYQELPNSKPDTSSWKRVGDVKALPLPMACTLKQFSQGNKYHFAVRAMDSHKRVGPYSDPTAISV